MKMNTPRGVFPGRAGPPDPPHEKSGAPGGRALPFGRRTLLAFAAGLALLLPNSPAFAGSNLVANGSFDAPEDNLSHWRYRYEAEGESWYTNNYRLVSIVDEDDGHRKVLRLRGTYAELQAPGQGIKVDSFPIPVDLSKGRYRFSISARSTGPSCRILIEGYRWAPGVTPHDQPQNTDLRKCFKFSQVYFGKQEAGEMASPGPVWQKGSTVFPTPKPSDLAKKSLSQVKFLVVHVVAIGGRDGDLFVDDASIERIQ